MSEGTIFLFASKANRKQEASKPFKDPFELKVADINSSIRITVKYDDIGTVRSAVSS